jgi:hypothetical protein
MPLASRLVAVLCLVCLASSLSFAANWSGFLVDSRCYDSEESNVNPTDTQLYVDRDRGFEIRYCSPRPKTKTFEVVLSDGTRFRLDSGGNAKAVNLVRNLGKKSTVAVNVTGEMRGNTVQVSSISLAK